MATGFTPEYNSTLMDSDSPFTAITGTEIPVQSGVPAMATVQTGLVFGVFATANPPRAASSVASGRSSALRAQAQLARQQAAEATLRAADLEQQADRASSTSALSRLGREMPYGLPFGRDCPEDGEALAAWTAELCRLQTFARGDAYAPTEVPAPSLRGPSHAPTVVDAVPAQQHQQQQQQNVQQQLPASGQKRARELQQFDISSARGIGEDMLVGFDSVFSGIPRVTGQIRHPMSIDENGPPAPPQFYTEHRHDVAGMLAYSQIPYEPQLVQAPWQLADPFNDCPMPEIAPRFVHERTLPIQVPLFRDLLASPAQAKPRPNPLGVPVVFGPKYTPTAACCARLRNSS
jgi:hypothetical protein